MGLGINELILFLFEHPMELLTGSAILGLNITKAIAAVIVMLWNFVVNRLVTFRDVKWQSNSPSPAASADEDEETVASAL